MTNTELKTISNTEFLKMHVSGGTELVILPHERDYIMADMQTQKDRLESVIQEKIKVTGGDDWHDGAFRVTDNEANIIRERMRSIAPFLTALVVEYPDESELNVTLGSRVKVRQNNAEFLLDIVSYNGADETVDPETGEEVMNATLNSPITKAILGKESGSNASYTNGTRNIDIEVLEVNQAAIKKQFGKV